MNELSQWLQQLRNDSKLSLAQLSEKTKITVRYLEALEQGELSALPTAVHARAFALAAARACGADDDEALEKVSAAFNAGRPQSAPQPAPAPQVPMRKGLKPRSAAPAPTAPAPAPAEVPAEAALPVPDDAPSGPLPWRLWGTVAGAALIVLLLLHTAVSCVRKSGTAPQPAPAAVSESESQALNLSGTAGVEGGEELGLRSRRPTWVLLSIDGQRLPVIFLERDKRERFIVKQKAVMLAGNIGAVRVWWRGDNLGYFGALGERMNGVVFEVGKPWRRDAAEDLPLPAGVPSRPGQ